MLGQIRDLAMLTLDDGQYYKVAGRVGLDDLHGRLCDALRGDRPRVVMQSFGRDGRVRTTREDGSSSERMLPPRERGATD